MKIEARESSDSSSHISNNWNGSAMAWQINSMKGLALTQEEPKVISGVILEVCAQLPITDVGLLVIQLW